MSYYLVKFLSRLFYVFPLSLALFIGRLLGRCFFYIDNKKRGTTMTNLKVVFPDKSFSEIKVITKKVFESFGQDLIEMIRAPFESSEYIKKYLTIENEQYFNQLIEEKGIVLGVHMGSWESLNVLLPSSFNYVVVAKAQRDQGLNRFLNETRSSRGLKVVFENELVKMTRYLKKSYVLGLVFDHGAKDSDLYADFFNKSVPVPVGGLRMALRLNKKVFPAVVVRARGPYHILKMFAPKEITDIEKFPEYSKYFNNIFENLIREYPWEYMWWFKRFKYARQKEILMIRDDKTGHTKQSQALIAILKKINKDLVVTEEYIKLNFLKRIILDLYNLCFSSRKIVGKYGLLRFVLGREFDRFFRYTDCVVSTGSGLASLNRILGFVLGVKSINILKPNVAADKFDALILPRHDRVSGLDNMLEIDGALSCLSSEKITQDSQKMAEVIKQLPSGAIVLGLFIGGDSKTMPFSLDINKLFGSLDALYKDINLVTILSTSTRTPKKIDENILQKSASLNFLKLAVIANKKNYDFAFGGILGLSDIILITSDSISMISEACSLSKPILVIDTGVEKSAKHKRFITNLHDQGIIKITTMNSLIDDVKDTVLKKTKFKRLVNDIKVMEFIKKRVDLV